MLGPLELGIILVIVLLLFGTKRLRSLGSDVGGAIKGFKKSMKDGKEASADNAEQEDTKIRQERDIDAEAVVEMTESEKNNKS